MAERNQALVSANRTTIEGPIAERVLDHLNHENDTLSAMLDAIRGVHVALRDLDDEALQISLEAESRELTTNVAIQERRRELQFELAPLLNVSPQDVTLRRLSAATSGNARDSIMSIWRSLSEMATEIDRLNRQNAAMIGQSLAIARNVLEQIAGVSGAGESYSATGTRAESHVGPLMQWGA